MVYSTHVWWFGGWFIVVLPHFGWIPSWKILKTKKQWQTWHHHTSPSMNKDQQRFSHTMNTWTQHIFLGLVCSMIFSFGDHDQEWLVVCQYHHLQPCLFVTSDSCWQIIGFDPHEFRLPRVATCDCSGRPAASFEALQHEDGLDPRGMRVATCANQWWDGAGTGSRTGCNP